MSVNYSVLVVEPDASLREQIARRLARRGYLVTAVAHPRQAMAAATFKDFRVVVVAPELPEIESPILIERLCRLIGEVQVVSSAGRSAAPAESFNEPTLAEQVAIAVARKMDSQWELGFARPSAQVAGAAT